jgi:hypothetical protein
VTSSHLADADRQLLVLAAAVFRYPARREALALERFGLTPTRFWARVDRLLDDPAAAAVKPVEVARLRRLRELRRQARRSA